MVGFIPEGAGRPEKVVRLCLLGNLQAEYDAALARHLSAKDEPVATMADQGRAAALAAELDEIRDRMQEGMREFRLRSLSRADVLRWRDDHAEDDEDTRARAWVRLHVVDPVLSDEEWSQLFDEVLTAHQFVELYNTADALSVERVSVPFSVSAYVPNPDSGETSK